jgi:hypothetical protein
MNSMIYLTILAPKVKPAHTFTQLFQPIDAVLNLCRMISIINVTPLMPYNFSKFYIQRS